MKKQLEPQKMLKVGFYRKEDWERFDNMNQDKSNRCSSWEEWHEQFDLVMSQFVKSGLNPILVIVDLDALEAYCKQKKLKNVGSTRSAFILQSEI
jgi:hypothetical protein